MSLQQETFVCLDVEATGLDVHNDRVIEVAAIRFTLNEMLDEFETLIDPQVTIPQESIQIHNISQDMVAGKPKIAQVLPELLTFVSGAVLVGHGIEFDIAILSHEAERAHLSHKLDRIPFIDTLRLARLYGQSPANSLSVLRQHFNVQAEGAHRARGDVVVNIQVFKHLSKKFRTLKEIQETLEKPIFMKNMPLGKHKGRPLKELPLNYLVWASHQKFDRDLLFSLRKEIQRRKKAPGFHEAANPFHAL